MLSQWIVPMTSFVNLYVALGMVSFAASGVTPYDKSLNRQANAQLYSCTKLAGDSGLSAIIGDTHSPLSEAARRRGKDAAVEARSKNASTWI